MSKMKKNVSFLMSIILLLSTLSSLEGIAAEQRSSTYYEWSEITSYREEQQAPLLDGHVFAGWYVDEECTEHLKPEESVRGAYAKFVKEETLSVRGQITKGTTAETEMTGFRLLTSVDSTYYQNVGFRIEANGKRQTIMSDTVYKEVIGYTKDGAKKYTPKEAFCEDSLYFMTFEITEVPKEVYGTGFVVTPMWTTLDGIVVTGRTQTLNVYSGLENKQSVGELSYGNLWSAPSTVKIMNTDSAADCAVATEAVSGQDLMSYQAVKNEYESVQLILSANQTVSSYALYANDLQKDNERILAGNVEVYQQKYINYDDTAYGYGSGSMPDALIPMSAAVNYADNKIIANQNGSLWVTIYVPKDTKAGTYTGNFMLVVDGAGTTQVIEVPVSLEVKDYTLADDPTAKTLFSWRYERVAAGELDGSVGMMEEYYEFYQDYRISLQSLPLGTMSGAEVKKALKEHGKSCSTFSLLNDRIGDVAITPANNKANFKEQILAIAEASAEDGYNYFTKAVCYSYDEPDIALYPSMLGTMVTIYNMRISVLAECIAEIETGDTYKKFREKYPTEWRDSIENMLDVLPLSPQSVKYIVQNKTEADVIAFLEKANCLCPQFSVAGESYYAELQELCTSYDITLWWYGCIYPTAPYPTYHIADSNLLSARSVSWIQNKYDIQGNLYWDASAYTMGETDEYTNVYEEPVRWVTAGDGNLTYPGAAYGVYGPIPSIRLMSIRDGMEEYEILQDVEKAYEGKAGSFGGTIDVDATMDSIFYGRLYSEGTQMNADGEAVDFTSLREQLLNMTANLNNGLGCGISKIEYSSSGWFLTGYTYKATLTCYAQTGSKLYIDGSSTGTYKLSSNVLSDTSVKITIENKEKNKEDINANVAIRVENAVGQTLAYTLHVGGLDATAQTGNTGATVATRGIVKTEKKYNAQENSELLLSFDDYANVTGTAIRVTKLFGEGKINTDTKFITEGTGSWMVRPEGDYGSKEYPWIKLRCTDSTFSTNNFENYKTVLLDVYNASDEEVSISWSFTAYVDENMYLETDACTYVLAPNSWTTCEYDLSDPMYATFYDLTEPVQYMTITFLDKKQSMDDTTSTLYLDNLRAVQADATREQVQYSFANGVNFEKETDLSMFKMSQTGNTAMGKERVAYSDTKLETSASNLGLGQYGLKAEATGSVWPRFLVKLDKEYETGKVLSFWMYVETDEKVAAGKTYSVEAGNQKSKAKLRVVNGRCQFNSWVQVSIELTEVTEFMYCFVNFDNNTGATFLGNHKVCIYMDNFRITDAVEGDSVTVDETGTVSMKTLDGNREVTYTYAGDVKQGDVITFNFSVLPKVTAAHIWVLGGTGDAWEQWRGSYLEHFSGPTLFEVTAPSDADGFRIVVSFDVEGDLSQYAAIIENLQIGGSGLRAEDKGDGDSTTLGDLFQKGQ